MTTQHPIRWQAPQPLWTRLPTHAMQARPALLRYATDDFMDQLLAALARDPSALDRRITRWESWREPIADGPDAIAHAPLPRLAQAGLRQRFARGQKAAIQAADPASRPLKLYQPAHQRYYIASASLVCGLHGLPDRDVIAGGSEEVGFVLRRLMPVPAAGTQPAGLREFAFIKDAGGARWQRCGDDPTALVANEERLPAFALHFQDDGARTRALWSGLVPVGRREEYLGAKVVTSTAPGFAAGLRESLEPAVAEKPDSVRARMVQFQMDVAEPWKSLIRACAKLQDQFDHPLAGVPEPESDASKRSRIWEFNLAQVSASWLILLDCADHIDAHMNDLWRVIEAGGAGYGALSEARKKLYDFLDAATLSPALKLGLKQSDGEVLPSHRRPKENMRDALIAIRASGVREALEAATITYNATTLDEPPWPRFHFALAGITNTLVADGPYKRLNVSPFASVAVDEQSGDPIAGAAPGQAQALWVDRFTAMFARALDPADSRSGPQVPYAAQVADALRGHTGDLADGGLFVVRYVYLRRDCGPLHPPVLSAPSESFQLASFFDADAPARPIRISLPMDVSPAGLRKFNRNTAFVMSDMLCGQVQRAKGLGFVDLVLSVLPWPFHKPLDVGAGGPCQNSGGLNIGMICSLSIPIITICALILLMIIVSLLDIIFRWMPYFVMCFPIPGLKGKKESS